MADDTAHAQSYGTYHRGQIVTLLENGYRVTKFLQQIILRGAGRNNYEL